MNSLHEKWFIILLKHFSTKLMHWRICWRSTTEWVRSHHQEVVTVCWAVKYIITEQAQFQSGLAKAGVACRCAAYNIQGSGAIHSFSFSSGPRSLFPCKEITKYICTSLLKNLFQLLERKPTALFSKEDKWAALFSLFSDFTVILTLLNNSPSQKKLKCTA